MTAFPGISILPLQVQPAAPTTATQVAQPAEKPLAPPAESRQTTVVIGLIVLLLVIVLVVLGTKKQE